MIIHSESTKCAGVVGADTNDALEVWYALKLESLGTTTLAALGISRLNKNMTRLGSHY